MQIPGPTDAHLEICRRALASSTEIAGQDALLLAQSDAAFSDVDLYRRLAASREPGEDALSDAGRLGAALNDQSILLVFGTGRNRVLLTGDMQFAEPCVNGLDQEMADLRQKISAAGPYKVTKLPHHGSHNGFDDSVRQEWAATRLFAISGGSKDSGHPAASVRSVLKAETNQISGRAPIRMARLKSAPLLPQSHSRLKRAALTIRP